MQASTGYLIQIYSSFHVWIRASHLSKQTRPSKMGAYSWAFSEVLTAPFLKLLAYSCLSASFRKMSNRFFLVKKFVALFLRYSYFFGGFTVFIAQNHGWDLLELVLYE